MWLVFEIVESMWMRVESSSPPGEPHRMEVTTSDIIILISSTAISRILTIADTMSHSSVRHPCCKHKLKLTYLLLSLDGVGYVINRS